MELKTSLAAKILAVMTAVDRIAKDKRNDFHKYDYASDEAVVSALRQAFIANRIIVYPKQVGCVREGDITSLQVAYHIVDVDSGEKEIVPAFGQGQDKGDKGVYKAATGAEKYFLLKTFLIPTGDDPEATNGDGQATKPKQMGNGYSKPPSQPPAKIMTDEFGDAIEPPPAEEEPAHWPHPAEATEKKPGCISDKQAKRFYAIAKGSGKTDQHIKEFLLSANGSAHSIDIPWKKYDHFCQEIAK